MSDQRPVYIPIGETLERMHDADHRRAQRFEGAVIGPWRVGKPAMADWWPIQHKDGSSRILRIVDLLALAERAQTNGHAVVLADHDDHEEAA